MPGAQAQPGAGAVGRDVAEAEAAALAGVGHFLVQADRVGERAAAFGRQRGRDQQVLREINPTLQQQIGPAAARPRHRRGTAAQPGLQALATGQEGQRHQRGAVFQRGTGGVGAVAGCQLEHRRHQRRDRQTLARRRRARLCLDLAGQVVGMAAQAGLGVGRQQRCGQHLLGVVGPGIGQHQRLRAEAHAADHLLRQFALGAQVQRLQQARQRRFGQPARQRQPADAQGLHRGQAVGFAQHGAQVQPAATRPGRQRQAGLHHRQAGLQPHTASGGLCGAAQALAGLLQQQLQVALRQHHRAGDAGQGAARVVVAQQVACAGHVVQRHRVARRVHPRLALHGQPQADHHRARHRQQHRQQGQGPDTAA